MASLLETGHQDELSFYTETALGDVVWGDRLAAEMHEYGAVSPDTFAQVLAVVLSWTEAQLQNPASTDLSSDLSATVRLADVGRLLPEYAWLTRQAFTRIQQRLFPFPPVLTHGDFHPYNLCGKGVIDLEFIHWSVAGYDAITGLLADDLLPSDPADYRYTAEQMSSATTAIDALFQRYHVPPASHYLSELRLCRMMRIVQLAERRPADTQQWIYQRYIAMATAYVAP